MMEGKHLEEKLLRKVKNDKYGKELVREFKNTEEVKGNLERYALNPYEAAHVLENMYVPYEHAFKMVKKSQPWPDPHKPATYFSAQLLKEIANVAQIPEESIAFYTAVGSALDRLHGVDGFIVFEGDVEQVVTFDVTMNTMKDAYKANTILQYEDDILDNRDSMKEFIKDSAMAIAVKFQKKA